MIAPPVLSTGGAPRAGRFAPGRDSRQVGAGKDPATIPVYYRTGGWQQLNKDGTRHPCPPPENLPTHIDIKKGDQ